MIASSACEASRRLAKRELIDRNGVKFVHTYASDRVLDRKSTNLNMADGSNPFGTIETGTKHSEHLGQSLDQASDVCRRSNMSRKLTCIAGSSYSSAALKEIIL